MENNERITLPGKGHSEIILETVNAVDEENDWRTSQNNRVMCGV